MSWLEPLHITPGITAVIGSGGKSSLLCAAAAELVRHSSVVLATSTHMLPPTGVPLYVGGASADLARLVERERLVCAGTPDAAGKLGASPLGIDELASCARYVLVEADGSRRLPLKAHATHEPQVPAQACQTILVVGGSGFDGRAREVAHRPELFCPRAGIEPDACATPEAAARCVASEIALGLIAPARVLVNQADACAPNAARRFARELHAHCPRIPILSAALNQHRIELVP